MKKRKALALWLAAIFMVSAIAGCSGGGDTGGESGSANGENGGGNKLPVRYLLPGSAPQGLEAAVKAINEKLEADGLNLTYEPTYIAWDVWDQKTNLMMSTGEEFELIAIMHDTKGPTVLAGSGGIIPIDDLLDQYGSELKASMPDWIWESSKINGKITYVPNFWADTAYNDGMFTIRTDLLEANGLKPPTSPEELLDAAETLQKNWPQDNKNVYIKMLEEPAYFLHTTYDTYPFTVADNMIYIDQQGNVKSWFETEEFKKDVLFMNQAYKRGLIMSDLLTTPSEVINQEELVGRYLYRPGDVGVSDMIRQSFPEAKLDIYYLADQPKFRSYAIRNSNGISATSPHPEAGVQFLNWVYSSQENMDLVQSGVKDVQWKDTGKNTKDYLAKNENGSPAYELPYWLLGHVEMNRYPTNTDPARLERRTSISDDAVNSITIGFTFDPSNVASQYANCIAELKTSVYPVMHGVVKYEDAYDKMLAAMKSAGLDEVVAEYKRQFDEWRAGQS